MWHSLSEHRDGGLIQEMSLWRTERHEGGKREEKAHLPVCSLRPVNTAAVSSTEGLRLGNGETMGVIMGVPRLTEDLYSHKTNPGNQSYFGETKDAAI